MAKSPMPKNEKIRTELIFKRNLLRLREAQNPSANLKDTAQGLNISIAYYHALEDCNRHTNPSFKILEQIAAYYHISVWELFIE